MDIYQDKTIKIHTVEKPATKGDIEIESQEQLQNINEENFAEIFSAASFASTVLFEQGGAQGTNIFIDDIKGSITARTLARKEDDGLSFQWKAKEYAQGEIDSYCAKIKDKCDLASYAGNSEQKTGKETGTGEKQEKKKERKIEEQKDEKTELGMQKNKNYLLDQLNRVP